VTMMLGAIDLVAMVAFGAAAVLAFGLSVDRRRRNIRPASTFLGLAALTYTVVSVSNSLERLEITAVFDVYEDYLEVLFVPFLAYSIFSWLSAQRLEDAERYTDMLAHEHDFLLEVVETTPTGILVVDDAGIPTFANENAREVLGLREEVASSRLTANGWRLRPMAGETGPAPPGRFVVRDPSRREEDVLYELRLPSGERRVLSVNSTPMADDTGGFGASLVAFQDITRRSERNGG
jgi:PAS domain S-box-containing protein